MKNFAKFFLRIMERIFFNKSDAEQTREIAGELKKLHDERPKLLEKQRAIRDGEYWEILEAYRKANTLSYSGEELEKLRANVWGVEKKMKSLLQEHDAQSKNLSAKLEALVRPFIREVRENLDRTTLEVDGEKRVDRLGDETMWVDTKEGWPKGVKVRKISHNLDVIEQVKNLITSCKAKISGMATASHAEILSEVKALEEEINQIDFSRMTEVEINELEFQNFRELKLL